MSIRKRLFLGFAGSALLVALVGAVSIFSLAVTAHRLRAVVATSLCEVQETRNEVDSALNVHTGMDAFQGAIDAHHLNTALAAKARVDSAFEGLGAPVRALREDARARLALARSAKDVQEETEQLARLDGLEATAARWKLAWRTACEASMREGKADQSLFDPCDAAYFSIAVASHELQKAATQETSQQLLDSADLAHTEWLVILASSSLAVALTVIIAFAIATPVSRRLIQIRTKAALFGNGDVSARVDATGHDEIRALGDTFNQMADSLCGSRDLLVETARRAEAASASKSAFLANMSHEIRTPMTAIMGYSELLLDPDQPASERQDSLQIIRRSARHLLELINDVLDLSKIEAKKMTTERIPLDLPQLTADVVSQMRPRAIAKGLGFRLSFSDMLPPTIVSDPTRLKQILMNIIGNAIKFTQRGEVRVHVAFASKGASNTVAFEVSDSGIGMTAEQIATLFQPFTQADDSMTRRFGGTGLGLAISRNLAEMLGGGIAVESLPGVGSKFRITIDAGGVDPAQLLQGLNESMLGPVLSEAGPGKKIRLAGRILLAEDGADNQRLISLQLRKAGAEVTIAANGRLALKLATSEHFDLILMDMQMPELDGYGATSELRRLGYKLPIVALTAHAMAEDRAKCLSAGCTEYLSKPVDKNTLLNVLASFLPGSVAEISAVPDACPDIPAAAAPHRSSMAEDPDMKEALQEFIAGLPPRVAEMAQLFEHAQWPALQRMVHQLKGAGGGYGFSGITKLATETENALRKQEPMAQLKADLDSLLAMVRSVDGYQPAKEYAHA